MNMSRVPPLKLSALQALCSGDLEHVENIGWGSKPGWWNSHTIGWLVAVGYAQLFDGRRRARITSDGRRAMELAA